MEGEAVFYGPKIDIKIKDALGRFWQCTTIQFDFNMSERFGMKYIGDDGQAHRPYMVHRALLGSLERFFGVLSSTTAASSPCGWRRCRPSSCRSTSATRPTRDRCSRNGCEPPACAPSST